MGAEIQSPEQATPALSDKEKAEQEKARAAAVAAVPSGRFVLFNGPGRAQAAARYNEGKKPEDQIPLTSPSAGASKAAITAQQWAGVGVSASQAHVWDWTNNWRIPVSQFTDQQIDYLLTNSKRFQLVDGRGNPVTR